jgi:hypothetical protein
MPTTATSIGRQIAIGLLALLTLVSFACAQIRLVGASDADWTVMTIAPNGAWGAATESELNRAIAQSIARCTAMAKGRGCGAYQISAQRRFAIAWRCGAENILAAGETLDQARQAARQREEELRRDYHPEMASCRQVATVAPDGSVTPAEDLISSASRGTQQ